MHDDARLWALANTGDDDAICALYLTLKRQSLLTEPHLARLSACTRDPALRLAFGPTTTSGFMDICAWLGKNDPLQRIQRIDTCLAHWPLLTRIPGPNLWDWLREPHKPRRNPAWSLVRHVVLYPRMIPWLDSNSVLQPITSLHISGNAHDLHSILASGPFPSLSRLEYLDLSSTYCAPVLSALVASPNLSALKELKLVNCSLNAQALEILCDSPPALQNLSLLDLSGNRLSHSNTMVQSPSHSPASTASLVISSLSRLPRLTHLTLNYCALTDDAANAFANSDLLSRLQWLGLGHNIFTSAGVRALSSSPYLHPALHMDLSNADTSDPSVMRAFHAAGVELIC